MGFMVMICFITSRRYEVTILGSDIDVRDATSTARKIQGTEFQYVWCVSQNDIDQLNL